jgi:hypothetical protein
MAWQKATCCSYVVVLAISGAALQLDGNQSDSFTLRVGLDKATTWANLQQGGCEMWAVIQLIVHSVMNTPAHSGSNTAYSAQIYEHTSTQWQ